MNNDILIKMLQNDCDINIHSITFHETKYIDLLYTLKYQCEDIFSSHVRKKSLIRDRFNFYKDKSSYKALRIINLNIKNKLIKKKKISVPNKIADINYRLDSMGPRESNNLGYVARSSLIGSMPHKKETRCMINEKGEKEVFEKTEHIIRNREYTLTMIARQSIGLPYGIIPRLLLAFITREVIIGKSNTIELGGSLNSFMKEVGYDSTGGEKGTINRFKDQMLRLFSCYITGRYHDGEIDIVNNSSLVNKYNIGWKSFINEIIINENSYVEINEEFYNEIISHPVPIDLRILDFIKSSSLAIDLYYWLTYRQGYIREKTIVPWYSLEYIFHSGYSRKRDFIYNVEEQIKKINSVYDSGASVTKTGIMIKPTKTSVEKTKTLFYGYDI